jgi:hypothetical protein
MELVRSHFFRANACFHGRSKPAAGHCLDRCDDSFVTAGGKTKPVHTRRGVEKTLAGNGLP